MDIFTGALRLVADKTGLKGKKSEVSTKTDISSGMNASASLTDENPPCEDVLAVMTLNTKSLCLAVAPVRRATLPLFMSEKLKIE
jgi:hypothetical protein